MATVDPTQLQPAAQAPQAAVGRKVNVFISYAKADLIVAKVLLTELQKIAHDRIDCFLDTESIQPGKPWERVLNQALEQADWLVCIYTGEQSEFCGYEIGVFSRVNEIAPGGRDSRLVCLHDVPDIPTVFQTYQNRLVTYPPELLTDPAQFNETEFYSQSELARFLSDLYAYQDLYVPRDLTEAQRQTQTLVEQVKRITEAFRAARGKDVRSDTPTQLGVEVFVTGHRGQKLTRIPPEAEVSGTFQSLALFGLMPPMQDSKLPKTSWAQIREAAKTSYRRLTPSIEFLEGDMLDAANGKTLSGREATFICDNKAYRPILARHVLFENGDQKFQVLFIETLPRQFLGKRHTSLILAGLLLASRFRFAYLEEPDVVHAKFCDKLPDSEFESNCWQLYYDIERWGNEAVELGLLNPMEFVKAFGEDRRAFAENLLQTMAASRARLFEALPSPGEHIGAHNRCAVRDAVLRFLDEVGPANGRFLTEGLEVYRNELAAQLADSEIPAARATVAGECARIGLQNPACAAGPIECQELLDV
jgi:TIR domain